MERGDECEDGEVEREREKEERRGGEKEVDRVTGGKQFR